MKLVVRLLTECFMLQVVGLRTSYGQLGGGKQWIWSRKRRQIKRLWDLDTWFGTRRSKVQILSPRPLPAHAIFPFRKVLRASSRGFQVTCFGWRLPGGELRKWSWTAQT